MPRLRLFQRRNVPVPTAVGMLLLAAVLVPLLVAAFRALPRFLALDAPEGHGLLVVEGWMSPDAFRLAAERFRAGGYEGVVVTGGPVGDPICGGTYAERGAAALRGLGIAESSLAVVPAPASAQDRTYRSAVALRHWLRSSGRDVRALDVFSQGPHARRSRAMFRKALGDQVHVGVLAAPPEYDAVHWWRHSAGARDVLTEAIGYAWMLCCFSPGPVDSHEELWGVPASHP